MADGSSIVSPIDRRKITPNEEIGVHTELLYSGTKDTPSISRTNVNWQDWNLNYVRFYPQATGRSFYDHIRYVVAV